mmetsp:Transcript_16446/g.39357  ORF Transcript_16446/g.39357 Transcript_16446/m.39357 type:complete len:487 (+) Transcript_16446:133-1593(+)
MAPFTIKSRSLEKKAGSASSSASAGNAIAGNATEDYSARRSARVDPKRYTADNDSWVEALAVCEAPVKPGDKPSQGGDASSSKKNGGGLFRKFKSNNGSNQKIADDAAARNDGAKKPTGDVDADVAASSQRLTLRPYFQSRNTGQRVWDEPPSGASEILYATSEARRMAHAQLEEMRSTYAHAAAARRREREEKKAEEEAASKKKPDNSGGVNKLAGLVPKKVFGKRSSAASASVAVDAQQSQSSSLLGHEQRNSSSNADEGGNRGGIPESILRESKKSARANQKSAYEADLQKAMLMSMELGGGSVMGVGDNASGDYRGDVPLQRHPPGGVVDSASVSGMTRDEEEQLAMATALSLSEQETRQGRSTARSKTSSSYGRNMSDSDDGGGNAGYLPLSDSIEGLPSKPRKSSSSSRTKNSSIYADATSNMKPRLSDFEDDFDGGGKMPAQNQKRGVPDDFGNRGASWEQEWNQSSSSLDKKKDWGMC